MKTLFSEQYLIVRCDTIKIKFMKTIENDKSRRPTRETFYGTLHNKLEPGEIKKRRLPRQEISKDTDESEMMVMREENSRVKR